MSDGVWTQSVTLHTPLKLCSFLKPFANAEVEECLSKSPQIFLQNIHTDILSVILLQDTIQNIIESSVFHNAVAV